MNYVSFYGGESTGSVGKKTANQIRNVLETPVQPAEPDKVCFHGYEHEEKSSSFFSKLIGAAACTAIVIGGLGYAHKANLIGKMKDGKLKDFLKKADNVTETCHNWCSKTKQCVLDGVDKIKSIFPKGK